jgi:hypothetical protein
MKLIGPLQGIAAYRTSVEEYQPETGMLPQELTELVRTAYGFQSFPQFHANAPLPAIQDFQMGRFSTDGESYVINRLIMTIDGDIAIATRTEQADLFLDDLRRLLDEKLGYRLRDAAIRKRFVSNIVIEFDRGLELYLAKLSEIMSVINDSRPAERSPFNIKRLSFGGMDTYPPSADPLVLLERADFTIDRREGHRFEENRYFSSAPMTTQDHIRVIEQIEAIARLE